ncbi:MULTISPECIES: glycine betaine ABC transporter substrate-binding protein [unclassified Halomonas]|uniref:glycine betaine ABC transporter substrate-binding protein n=1 Tax=unclassified Halomonas TaxID=2609666 RepID=UPI000C8A7E96|nr:MULTISPECIES: glycine betaine ABC transporter substrate-binding protein [unclassified Halomonas]MAR73420.1 glycine/betaine ABC transporter substrate-binding protein [Halomonas sp.]MBR9882022.1 glycine betaine ABC transporter substrate-binding protein [Gammaproteobacteria bacterium]|tara:strand:- start:832 stop:1728 length:897 start_codon:yes stop_codon:yes gene_type:complete
MTLQRRATTTITAGLLTLFAMTSHADDNIVVGGKNFTEQQIISSMTAQYLDHLGYDVDKRAGMGSAVLRQAQENGQVDLYWEYTGTSLIVFNGVEEKLDSQETYDRVKALDAEKGLAWLEPSGVNNTYAIAMREADAEAMEITSISDMAEAVNAGEDLLFASNAEFYARPDGLRPMQDIYGFQFERSDIKRMDTGLTYTALRDDQVDIAMVTTTDGRVSAFDLRILEDDKGFFPPYAMTPVVRQETLDTHPELEAQLNALVAKLDDEVMTRLNEQVDVNRDVVETVAEQFLVDQGLID